MRGARRLFIVAAVAWACSARADENNAAAEALYEEATRLLAAGDVGAACPKFAESKRLSPGIGVTLYLGDCLERTGRLASAWAEFREAAYTAIRRGDARANVARERADQLEPRLSRVKIAISPADAEGLEVKVDGTIVGRAAWDTPVPVDPGEHSIEAGATGKRAVLRRVRAPEPGRTVTVTIELEAEAAPPSAPPVSPRPVAPPGSNAQRVAGMVVLGVGGVGILVGSVAGSLAAVARGDLGSECRQNGGSYPSNCGAGTLPPDRRSALESDARRMTTLANVSTVAFLAGGVFAATGAILFFTAPKRSAAVGMQISPGSAALLVPW